MRTHPALIRDIEIQGLTPGPRPRFTKNFLHGLDDIEAAARRYALEVRTGQFPAAEHSF